MKEGVGEAKNGDTRIFRLKTRITWEFTTHFDDHSIKRYSKYNNLISNPKEN